MRLLIALLVAGFVYWVIPVYGVAYVVTGVVWLGLCAYSPGICPHCRKGGVAFMANTCHRCGKDLKATSSE